MTLETRNVLEQLHARLLELAESGILSTHPAGRDLVPLLEEALSQMDSGLIKRALDERSLLGLLPVGVIRVSREGAIEYANSEFGELVGHPATEFEGYFLRDLADSADAEMVTSVINAVNQSGGRAEIDATFLHAEGTRALRIRFSSVSTGSAGIIGIVEDQTHLADMARALEAEQKRSESSRMLAESILACSSDPIVLYDEHLQVRYASPAFTDLFGWAADSARGRELPECPEGESVSSRLRMEEVMDTGTPVRNFVTRRRTRTGEEISVCASMNRYQDPGSGMKGLLVVYRDMGGSCTASACPNRIV